MKKMNKDLTAVLSDMHVPDEDWDAVDYALKRIREEGAGKIVILGDLADFHAISRFNRKLVKRAHFEHEIEAVRELIRILDDAFKGREVHYLCGNHESRLSKYITRNCPELSSIPSLAFREIVNIPNRWMLYEYNLNAVCIDGVNYIHGRKFSNNVCISNLRKYMGSVVQGHSHRSSSQYLRLPNGELIGAVEAGCLCELDPSYASDVNWSHAMAWAEDGLPYLELL